METKPTSRGLDIKQERAWIAAVEKEEKLRLKWFEKNEHRLQAGVQAPLQRVVPPEVKEELRERRKNYHANKENNPRKIIDQPTPPVIDPESINHIMRPVDPNTRKLLYWGDDVGRVNYLNERVKLSPEKRYYCTETTSYVYGWNMWDHAKTRVNYGHGRSQIIKQSFYRRRGVERDPDWYTIPAKLSPTVCDCQ